MDATNSGTVYIVNKAGLDFSEAEKFGELVYVTQGYATYNNLYKLTQQIMAVIGKSSKDDYLVLSGNNLLCAITYHLWMELHGKVNILHWADNKYTVIPCTPARQTLII